MGYPEHGYAWTDYATREDLPEVTGDKFTRFIKSTRNDKADKSKWFLPHDDW